MKEKYNKELSLEIKKTLESSNISFLIGAGCSAPAVSVLGNIEADLQDQDQNKKDQAETKLKSIFKSICESVVQDFDSKIATKHELAPPQTDETLLPEMTIQQDIDEKEFARFFEKEFGETISAFSIKCVTYPSEDIHSSAYIDSCDYPS